MPSFPKPTRSLRLERHDRKLAIRAKEDAAKKAAKIRDQHACRWPRCAYRAVKQPLDAAHLDDKGMGGDHGGLSDTRCLVALCREHHQGRVSLHSKDLTIQALTPDGADGPLLFLRFAVDASDASFSGWYVVAEEVAPRIYRKD